MPAHRKQYDIKVGDKFGLWTILGPPVEVKRTNGNSHTYVYRYPCVCDCGTKRTVSTRSFFEGAKSCGCLWPKELSRRLTKHGAAQRGKQTRLFNIWKKMKSRCHGRVPHPVYGGRGIGVCPEWRESFPPFRDWAVANGYTDKLTIDRKDNELGYFPENCRWATRAQQNRNRRDNHFLTWDGRTMCLMDWSKEVGIHYCTIVNRIRIGWSTQDVLFQPPGPSGRRYR